MSRGWRLLATDGYIPAGRALKRSGAKPGDWIYVTGTPGDSAAGLDAHYLIQRHLRPTPRILHGQALRDIASAAIDLSDGLISDLGHIVKASGWGGGRGGGPFTCIGQMSADIEGLNFVRDGMPVTFDWKGYDHFATP